MFSPIFQDFKEEKKTAPGLNVSTSIKIVAIFMTGTAHRNVLAGLPG